MQLFASCAFGLEKLVEFELKDLGLWVTKTEDGRVSFDADEIGLIKANLWLRCADRVQIKMGEFKAKTFDELFDAVIKIEWEKYIGPNDIFPIKAGSVKSILHSEPAIQSIVKKAIVNRLKEKHHTENLPENSSSIYKVIVKANKDNFIIAIDSSGDSLHKRGYRKHANLAPIKETLAAAMVKLSDWSPGRSLVDPFCGSGTIAIEAAMIASNTAPGLYRDFAFHYWKSIKPEKIKEAYDHARQEKFEGEIPPIYCFDIDPEALMIAEKNARQAGFKNIVFRRSDFNDLDFAKFENCTFITNPPYGERLEDLDKVEEMSRKLGVKFAQTKNCSLFIITPHENFPYLFDKAADKNRKLFNGKIRCYLFSFF